MIDFHIHTIFSDGEKSPEEIIDLAVEKGLEAIAITDHFDPADLHQSNTGVNVDDLLRHFERIRAYSDGKPLRVYCGIETCPDDEGRLRIPKQCREACDIIISSPHFLDIEPLCRRGEYMNDSYWQAYKRKLLNMASGEGDVLGHPEGYLPIGPMRTDDTTYESRQQICREICERYLDEEFVEEFGDRLAASGIACELHGATGTPREWVVESLHRKGIAFSIGSDAHATNILGENKRAAELVQRLRLKLYCPRIAQK